MKQEHPHAAFLRAIADGEPIENFEFTYVEEDGFFGLLHTLGRALLEPKALQIRRKPRTIMIGNTEVQAGITEAPEVDTRTYVADPTACDYRFAETWVGHRSDIWRMKRGLIHLTQEPAEAMGKALAAITEHKE